MQLRVEKLSKQRREWHQNGQHDSKVVRQRPQSAVARMQVQGSERVPRRSSMQTVTIEKVVWDSSINRMNEKAATIFSPNSRNSNAIVDHLQNLAITRAPHCSVQEIPADTRKRLSMKRPQSAVASHRSAAQDYPDLKRWMDHLLKDDNQSGTVAQSVKKRPASATVRSVVPAVKGHRTDTAVNNRIKEKRDGLDRCFREIQHHMTKSSIHLEGMYERLWKSACALMDRMQNLIVSKEDLIKQMNFECERLVRFCDRKLFQYQREREHALLRLKASTSVENNLKIENATLESQLKDYLLRVESLEETCQALEGLGKQNSQFVDGDQKVDDQYRRDINFCRGRLEDANMDTLFNAVEVQNSRQLVYTEGLIHETRQLDWRMLFRLAQRLGKAKAIREVACQTLDTEGCVCHDTAVLPVHDTTAVPEHELGTDVTPPKVNNSLVEVVPEDQLPEGCRNHYFVLPLDARLQMNHDSRGHDRVASFPNVMGTILEFYWYKYAGECGMDELSSARNFKMDFGFKNAEGWEGKDGSVAHGQHSKGRDSTILNKDASAKSRRKSSSRSSSDSNKVRRSSTDSNRSTRDRPENQSKQAKRRRSSSRKSSSPNVDDTAVECNVTEAELVQEGMEGITSNDFSSTLHEFFVLKYEGDVKSAEWYLVEFVQGLLFHSKNHERIQLFLKFLGNYETGVEWYPDGVGPSDISIRVQRNLVLLISSLYESALLTPIGICGEQEALESCVAYHQGVVADHYKCCLLKAKLSVAVDVLYQVMLQTRKRGEDMVSKESIEARLIASSWKGAVSRVSVTSPIGRRVPWQSRSLSPTRSMRSSVAKKENQMVSLDVVIRLALEMWQEQSRSTISKLEMVFMSFSHKYIRRFGYIMKATMPHQLSKLIGKSDKDSNNNAQQVKSKSTKQSRRKKQSMKKSSVENVANQPGSETSIQLQSGILRELVDEDNESFFVINRSTFVSMLTKASKGECTLARCKTLFGKARQLGIEFAITSHQRTWREFDFVDAEGKARKCYINEATRERVFDNRPPFLVNSEVFQGMLPSTDRNVSKRAQSTTWKESGPDEMSWSDFRRICFAFEKEVMVWMLNATNLKRASPQHDEVQKQTDSKFKVGNRRPISRGRIR